MTQLEAIRMVCGACCVSEKDRLEAVQFLLGGADSQRVVDAINHLSEGYMALTDIYYRIHDGGNGTA
ncbi:MAG: hypothetical protein CEN87_414 [Parcubacteria group bacterium Licking1014_1]|nr:MAG: hypothetical protein CEN87_414 [Parcubacteria group bacterium Licking1014_1]